MLVVPMALALAGCDDYPRDSAGTLESVRSGERPLRVGWSSADPWARAGADGQAHGLEPALVRAFAASLDAQIDWHSGSEAELVEALQRNALDIAVAGFTDSTPWKAKIGYTQPYMEAEVVVGIAAGGRPPGNWTGVEIRYDRRRPGFAAKIRAIGAVPIPVAPGESLAPLGAVYRPELAASGLSSTGTVLDTESRIIATAPAENALTLVLDRFLHERGDEIGTYLARGHGG